MRAPPSSTRRYGWEAALIAVTVVWGFTFPVVKCSLEPCPSIKGGLGLASLQEPTSPLLFLSLRFGLAALLVGAISLPALRALTRRQLAAGAAVGLAVAAGFTFQTLGLQRTGASEAGFVTGLYVVLTPLFGALWYRRLPAAAAGIASVVALGGLLLISSPAGISLGLGNGLVLLCAAAFAVQILMLDRVASLAPVAALATIQLAVTAVVTGIGSAATERAPLPSEGAVWTAIAVTAVLASAGAYLIQTGAQRFIAPTRTAVILTMESPFAGLFGYLMLGEHLGARGWAGAGLILAAMLGVVAFAPSREEL